MIQNDTKKEKMMPIYDFCCKKCKIEYDVLAKYDESGKYPDVVCPECGSKKKEKVASVCSFAFTNPVGTARWNNGSTGHDYRFKHNIPKVQQEREMAKKLSHMGTDPYKDTSSADIERDTGVHDVETRPGLG